MATLTYSAIYFAFLSPIALILCNRFIMTKKLSLYRLYLFSFIIIFITLTSLNVSNLILLVWQIQEFDLNLDGVIGEMEMNSAVSNNREFLYMYEDAIYVQIYIAIISVVYVFFVKIFFFIYYILQIIFHFIYRKIGCR